MGDGGEPVGRRRRCLLPWKQAMGDATTCGDEEGNNMKGVTRSCVGRGGREGGGPMHSGDGRRFVGVRGSVGISHLHSGEEVAGGPTRQGA